jgi:hypothetical protein
MSSAIAQALMQQQRQRQTQLVIEFPTDTAGQGDACSIKRHGQEQSKEDKNDKDDALAGPLPVCRSQRRVLGLMQRNHPTAILLSGPHPTSRRWRKQLPWGLSQPTSASDDRSPEEKSAAGWECDNRGAPRAAELCPSLHHGSPAEAASGGATAHGAGSTCLSSPSLPRPLSESGSHGGSTTRSGANAVPASACRLQAVASNSAGVRVAASSRIAADGATCCAPPMAAPVPIAAQVGSAQWRQVAKQSILG